LVDCRGKQFFVDFKLEKGQILVWRFSIGCGFDVDFCAFFRESQLKHKSGGGDGAVMSSATYDTASKIFGQISSQLFDKILQRGLRRLDDSLRQPEFRTVQLATPLRKCYGVKSARHSSPAVVAPVSTTSVEGGDEGQVGDWDGNVGLAGQGSGVLDSVPLTGSFSADKGGGVLRLVWDNSFSRFTGKHIQFCVQCVPETTMQVEGRVVAFDVISFVILLTGVVML
jgi:hypothetical protein